MVCVYRHPARRAAGLCHIKGMAHLFRDKDRDLLYLNISSMVIAVLVIAPVLFAMTKVEAKDVQIANVLNTPLVWIWAFLLALDNVHSARSTSRLCKASNRNNLNSSNQQQNELRTVCGRPSNSLNSLTNRLNGTLYKV